MVQIIRVHPGSPPFDVRVTRKNSRGQIEGVLCTPEDEQSVRKWFAHDSVQVSCCGKFKIGDRVRPTKEFIDSVLGGSIPYECIAQWPQGYKVIEIGPEGFPWRGCHNIDLEGFDVIGLTTEHIEKVS